jgi:hypothetical protein
MTILKLVIIPDKKKLKNHPSLRILLKRAENNFFH